jgi:tol-pal system protein YbgF
MTLRVAALSLALAWVSACVTVPEFRALEREVYKLKRGSGGAGPAGSRLADLGEEVSKLREEIAQLRGAVEEAQHAAEQAMEEARVAREHPRSVAPAPAGSGNTGAASGTARAREEIGAYEEAFRLYRAAEYRAAIDRFRAFLQTHPSSDYADNAQFWLAECYFKLGDHEQAVLAFQEVVQKYPEGNKVPDALYRQGIALLEIGKSTGDEAKYRPAAQQIFERLVTRHPDSERVPEARRQLEKLGT